LVRIYWTYLKTTLALQFQYRAAMGLYMIGRIVEPTVYLVVWSSVAAARGGSVGAGGGFAAADFAAYYITLMVVNQFTFTWIMWEYSFRVRSGELSPILLKPIHPIHSDLADNIGYKILTVVVILPAAALLTWIFRPEFTFSGRSVLLFLPSLIMAFLLRFFVEWAVAQVAFWTTRVDAVNQTYMLLGLFLSGRIAPLGLMPAWVRRVAWFLPFRWSVAFPVELVLGRLDGAEIREGLLMQAVWTALGLLLVRVLWRRGIRNYSAVGA
jgi:ABC-2 type transport system permease protein